MAHHRFAGLFVVLALALSACASAPDPEPTPPQLGPTGTPEFHDARIGEDALRSRLDAE